jgi:hypothetical protein
MTTLFQIRDRFGKIIYRCLVDDGTPALRFASGYGFIDRYDLRRNGWTIEPMPSKETDR